VSQNTISFAAIYLHPQWSGPVRCARSQESIWKLWKLNRFHVLALSKLICSPALHSRYHLQLKYLYLKNPTKNLIMLVSEPVCWSGLSSSSRPLSVSQRGLCPSLRLWGSQSEDCVRVTDYEAVIGLFPSRRLWGSQSEDCVPVTDWGSQTEDCVPVTDYEAVIGLFPSRRLWGSQSEDCVPLAACEAVSQRTVSQSQTMRQSVRWLCPSHRLWGSQSEDCVPVTDYEAVIGLFPSRRLWGSQSEDCVPLAACEAVRELCSSRRLWGSHSENCVPITACEAVREMCPSRRLRGSEPHSLSVCLSQTLRLNPVNLFFAQAVNLFSPVCLLFSQVAGRL
jgi:hypothetical protein